ncbi:MAG TPA: S66 peptidase family protein [Streptosporangiaceae bacterium]|nr:S66 peptidase family protein [Streptosporangiaceae bacterium]
MPVVPPKLHPGSSVRVIAPSRSLAIIPADARAEAGKKLSALGLRLSFGEHVEECDDFVSSPVAARLADLHAAFEDPGVDGILTVIGGHNTNQLLAGIDYGLVAAHPKVLCGFSDITALSSALYAATGLVGYSGPHYSSFGMKHHFGYTEAGFVACVMRDDPFRLEASPAWSDDEWYLDQEDRHLETGTDWWVLQEGEAAGTIVGGNLCTFSLLAGTPYMPPLDGAVVFAEDDDQARPWDVDRNLVSLLQQPAFGGVRGLVIGRFQRDTGMTRELLAQIVATKPELAGLPVLANVDFGHTSPMATFPIGGTVEVRADRAAPRLTITTH